MHDNLTVLHNLYVQYAYIVRSQFVKNADFVGNFGQFVEKGVYNEKHSSCRWQYRVSDKEVEDAYKAIGEKNEKTIEEEVYAHGIEEAFQSKSNPSDRRFHNLKYIEKVAEVPADALSGKTRSGGSTMGSSTTKYSVADLIGFVNRYDKNFHAGKEVSQYLLNEDGTPKVFYHGGKEKWRFYRIPKLAVFY